MNDAQKLESFCRQALEFLGAIITTNSDVARASLPVQLHGQDGRVTVSSRILDVQMPPSLLDLFDGRSSLKLAFAPELAGEGIELVVPSSYVLERLLEAVRKHGRLSEIRLQKSAANVSSSPGIEILNGEARFVSAKTSYKPLLLVNYRINMISDEDQERIYSVVIDPGSLKPLKLDPAELLTRNTCNAIEDFADDEIDLNKVLDAAMSAACDYARETAESIQQSINDRLWAETQRLETYYKDLLTDSIPNGSKDIKKLQRRRDKAFEAYEEASKSFEVARELLQSSEDQFALGKMISEKRKTINRSNPRKKLVFSLDIVHELPRLRCPVPELMGFIDYEQVIALLDYLLRMFRTFGKVDGSDYLLVLRPIIDVLRDSEVLIKL